MPWIYSNRLLNVKPKYRKAVDLSAKKSEIKWQRLNYKVSLERIKIFDSQYFGSGETIMFFIVLGISVFAAVSGVLFISHWKLDENKDYLYDETDSFGKRQLKRWRF